MGFFFLLPLQIFGQSETVQQALEYLSENQELNIDYSILIEELDDLTLKPINLNSSDIDQLHNLFLIDAYQLENLRAYIQDNGPLLSVYELQLIEGFNRANIEVLLPFVEAKAIEKTSLPKIRSVFKYGKHNMIIRAQRILEKSIAYQNYEEGENINAKYLGDPNKYYLKYKFNYSRKFQWGFTMEKDAGELFLSEPKNIQLQTASHPYYKKGFDFNSFHLFGKDLGIIKQIAIGDYHLLLGQGLTLWSGISFGKSANAVDLKRYESFIKPNTSSYENRFFRGMALHLGKQKWSAVLFYSKNQQDASTFENENGETQISTLLNTGLHRTVLELSKKNSLDIQVIGGRFKYTFNAVSIGITAFNTRFSNEIQPTNSIDNIFDFRGNQLTNYGLDYAFRWWRAHFYGEASLSSTGGKAILTGINLPLNSRFKLSFLYRNYAADYHNFYASAISENSSPVNEKAFYIGSQILISKKINLQAYADFFRFPWLKFEQDAPSKGVEYKTIVNYDFKHNVKMYFTYRYKQKQVNLKSENIGENNYLATETKNTWQFQINYNLNERLELRNRLVINQFEDKNNIKNMGYMAYQDLNYKSPNQKFGSNIRFAIFNTDSFSSAIYAYEHDVLYAFSIPAYSGKGIRFYAMANYEISNNIKCWLRYSLSYYPDENSIGSGYDEINGNQKSEVKLQLLIKI